MLHKEFITSMPDVQTFHTKMNTLSEKWDLLTLLGSMSHIVMDTSQTRKEFEVLLDEPLTRLIDETLHKSLAELGAKSQAAIDILVRNLFERTADIGFLATDEDIRNYILFLRTPQEGDQWRVQKVEHKKRLIERFREYVAKYSVYENVILCDTQGKVLAQLDPSSSLAATKDPLIKESLFSSQGYVQTYRETDLTGGKKGLIYSYRVGNHEETEDLGVLCLVFKFEDEMEGIFKKFTLDNPFMTLALLDPDGYVVSTSSPITLPKGSYLSFGDEPVIFFAGTEYLYRKSQTSGYQGYMGLGWSGVALVPVEFAFRTKKLASLLSRDELFEKVVSCSHYFPTQLQEILEKAHTIQSDLEVTVWNGNAKLAQKGGVENPFSKALLSEVSKTGHHTKQMFDSSIGDLNKTRLTTLVENLKFHASLAVEIMDRNLYERANDCRWWALTDAMRLALSKEMLSEEDKREIGDILAYINSLYTVYSSMMVYDKHGVIVAVSTEKDLHWIGKKIGYEWAAKGLELEETWQYSVSDFVPSVYYDERHTYIYNASIKDHENKSVGGIAIVFDSEPQFQAMLEETLPIVENKKSQEELFSLFVQRDGKIIASTSLDYHVGDKLLVDKKFLTLPCGEGSFGVALLGEKFYAVGAMTSFGYREYKQKDGYKNDIIALVCQEIGDASAVEFEPLERKRFIYPATVAGEESIPFSTFYVGERLFAVESTHVMASLSHQEVTTVLNPGPYTVGLLTYEGATLSVVSLSKLLGGELSYNKESDMIVVVTVETQGMERKFGFVVDAICDSPEIPSRSIGSYDSPLKHNNSLTKGVIMPDSQGDRTVEMPSIIDVEKVYNLLLSKR